MYKQFNVKNNKNIIQDTQSVKNMLLKQLKDAAVFWSYDKNFDTISDWNLIKLVLIHLDLDSINLLFQIFPQKQIKRVWLDELVIQGDYLKNMNLCFANLYFNVKEPVRYLKRIETYKRNRLWNGRYRKKQEQS
ncbi:MAG: hypothetical protein EZS26_001802 [Candidatus Ordinivivax streblomastigis]|uniref:Uncharacterized protein n=1 Tax=Candidatus Ordinivivax streblomastigis TaxID=2540710 RepID=A0A5M8P0V4_9BACT|nr:MAG: hypothetical protein EZS26_001802 [Candidatus Ordinivivax streblomastigis]